MVGLMVCLAGLVLRRMTGSQEGLENEIAELRQNLTEEREGQGREVVLGLFWRRSRGNRHRYMSSGNY